MVGPPPWIAQRHEQDWRDEESLAAIRWMTQSLDPSAWRARLDAVADKVYEGRSEWQRGNRVPLFDMRDLAAWFIFQGNAYAADRSDDMIRKPIGSLLCFGGLHNCSPNFRQSTEPSNVPPGS